MKGINQDKINKRYSKIAKEIGIPINWKGYRFLNTAVHYVIEMENEDYNLMYIYHYVAKKHKTTASKVERAIRYIHTQKQANIRSYFKVDYRIFNANFIELVKEKIVLWRTAENVEL